MKSLYNKIKKFLNTVIHIEGHSTYPSKEYSFWQCLLIPTISLFCNKDEDTDYFFVHFEWLFWSLTFAKREKHV